MDSLLKIFNETALPYIVAASADNEREADRILKLNELCKKHGVSFVDCMNIISEYAEWEVAHYGRD